jgi:hypothetical protein
MPKGKCPFERSSRGLAKPALSPVRKRPLWRSSRSFGEQRSCGSASGSLGGPVGAWDSQRSCRSASGRLGEPPPMPDRTGRFGTPVGASESSGHAEGQPAVWVIQWEHGTASAHAGPNLQFGRSSGSLGEPALMPVRKRQFGRSSGRVGEPTLMPVRKRQFGGSNGRLRASAHAGPQAAVWSPRRRDRMLLLLLVPFAHDAPFP